MKILPQLFPGKKKMSETESLRSPPVSDFAGLAGAHQVILPPLITKHPGAAPAIKNMGAG